MFLPPIKRLSIEDFGGEQKWIGKLLGPLNQVFTSLANGLQHGITFKDNIAAHTQTVQFNNNSAELSSTSPIRFTLTTLNTTPTGMWIINAKDASSIPQSLTTAPFATWSYDSSSKQISITAITGLVANQTYQVTFIVI